jgi:hypothetical protein
MAAQAHIKILGRLTDQNVYRTILRTTSAKTLYIRIVQSQIFSYSIVADGSWHNIKLFHNAKESRYGMVLYGMVWYGMVWYGMVWYGMVWYVTVRYGMVWYGMVWYGIWYGVRGLVWYSMMWAGGM